MKVEPAVFASVDDVNQVPNRGSAEMRTFSRTAAAAFVTWIETELHRHSPKRNDNQLPKSDRETKPQFE